MIAYYYILSGKYVLRFEFDFVHFRLKNEKLKMLKTLAALTQDGIRNYLHFVHTMYLCSIFRDYNIFHIREQLTCFDGRECLLGPSAVFCTQESHTQFKLQFRFQVETEKKS